MPVPDTILTSERAASAGIFLVALAAALFLCATASATPSAPRVLAVKFENDVNPVTQDYVNGRSTARTTRTTTRS